MAVSFNKPPKNKLTIHVKNYVGNTVLNLDSSYRNELGQAFTITNFKYYISNICLKQADGKKYQSEDYFLVDEFENDSKKLILNNVPEGNYTSIEFTIGVDSLHNCSGLQNGALDPTNGMFWAWNTGYIFLKLEGISLQSKLPGHIFEYHIGGFKKPSNCIRKINIEFKNNSLVIEKKSSSLIIKADAMQVLKQPTNIDFVTLPSVTDFRYATLIADNYADMFSFLEIKNEK